MMTRDLLLGVLKFIRYDNRLFSLNIVCTLQVILQRVISRHLQLEVTLTSESLP